MTAAPAALPPPLLPTLTAPAGEAPALRFADGALTHAELAGTARNLVARLAGARRVAVFATPTLATAVGVVAGLVAGVPVIPVNPRIGDRELDHVLNDAAPDLVLAAPGVELPAALAGLPRLDVAPHPDTAAPIPAESDPGAPGLIVYTSGTTGPPKGAVLSRGAIASNLDALAQAWEWTAADLLVHALPLFHVHGLVLGVLGPLRRGGAMTHLGALDAEPLADAVRGAGAPVVVFGVPTQYHRLADALADDPVSAAAVGRARLLVSGSAALTAVDHARIERATGLAVRERYGLTETLILTAARAGEAPEPGAVGRALPGTEVRLEPLPVEDGRDDGAGLGSVQVRGPGLFSGYLNRPDLTAAARTEDGWFVTGDIGRWTPSGALALVGRSATDLIKSGGYKIGAGEIENALQEHPGVAEAAVVGVADDDLGERVVAHVVAVAGAAPTAHELADHVAALLAPHKRPREVHFTDVLPRNDMGKVVKSRLPADPTTPPATSDSASRDFRQRESRVPGGASLAAAVTRLAVSCSGHLTGMPDTSTTTSAHTYRGPAATGAPNLAGLPAHVSAREPHLVLEVERHDTDDLRLASAGIVLTAHRGGEPDHWRLDLPDGAGTERLRVPVGPDGALPPGIDDLVRGARGDRPLRPVGTARTVRTSTQLTDDDARVLAVVVHDDVSVATQGSATELRSWTAVHVDGVDSDLVEGIVTRVAELGLVPGDPDPEQVLDELLAATATRPRRRRGWGAKSSAGAVLMAYLAAQVDRIAAQDLRARRDEPDAVHQLRVAARRARSALRAYRPLLDRAATDPLTDELRRFGQVLAPARDAEVLHERISVGLADLEPTLRLGPVQAQVTRHFGRVQAEARAAVLSELDGERYARLRADLQGLLDRPPLTRRAARPAAKELPQLARRSATRLQRAVATAVEGEHTARDEAVHAARKAGKRLRYATEVARPAVGKPATRFVKQLKGVQTALGEHQDAVVAQQTLRDLGARAGAEGANGFSFGVLLGRDVARARMVEARLPGLWERAWTRKHRAWLR